MTDSDSRQPETQDRDGDVLSVLIRTAGRRPEPPPEHYASVLAASRAAWQAKVSARRRKRSVYALVASLVAALAATAALQLMTYSPPAEVARAELLRGSVAVLSETGTWLVLGNADAAVHAGERIRTADTSAASFRMSNGASLRIRGRTELKIESADSVELVAGTVYVDSHRVAQGSVIEIITELGVVRDIGTQFEVHAESRSLRLRVRSGGVQLIEPTRGIELESAAGEELELTEDGAVRRRAFAPHDEAWAWAEALAAVPVTDGESVFGYLQWVARETGRELRFDTQSTRIRAELEQWRGDARGLTPMQVLESIAATSDFQYELTRDGAILIQRR